ncbi:MAG: DUF4258 domain-containing protein [Candidatus Omnitrophica bacterium]|nr:DUF4258 domain-containing protein [Candidatus Omnitrophota bacterium]
MPKKIIFCTHAENKFRILAKHGLKIAKTQILDAINNAESIVEGERSRKIAQRPFNSEYLLRVIFEETDELITVITFYPAKRSRYEH